MRVFGPIRFEDDVELNLRVTKVGEKSFNYEVDFMLAGRRMALGKITSVCCILESGTMRDPHPPRIAREAAGRRPLITRAPSSLHRISFVRVR